MSIEMGSRRSARRARGYRSLLTGLYGAGVILVASGTIIGCAKGGSDAVADRNGAADSTSTPATAAATPAVSAERGKYIVTIGACNDCHTPFKMGANGPEPDMSRMLSGHPSEMKLAAPAKLEGGWMWQGAATNTAFAGPWGITYAMNLTPDSLTGIGTWTEDMFVKTIRTGKHWGTSRPIMPPMPWQWYSNMTDEDLKSVYAYLRTVPAVNNKVPDYQPPAAPTAEKPTAGGN